MQDIDSVKNQLLIIMKKDNIERVRLNVSGVLYIMDKIEDRVDIRIIYNNNIIVENIKMPKAHFCKSKTSQGKRCKNKTYDNFCHLH